VVKSDRGSILPLGLAGLALTLAVTLLFLELTGIELQTLRNKQLADVMALKTATDLKNDQIPPVVGLDYVPAIRPLIFNTSKNLRLSPTSLRLVSHDGKTMEAMVCTRWISITGFSFGNFGGICATSKARAVS